MLTLASLIWISPFISKIIKIPTPPVEIILGSLLAYVGFVNHHEYFDLLAEVGFLYLMFLAGMEVDLKHILSSSRSLIQKSILFLVIMGLFSLFFGWLFELSIIVIISLPLISIGLLASLSKVYGKEQEWLKLAFIVGVLGEIISIATLTTLEAASSVGFSMELFYKMGYLVIFLSVILALYRLLNLLFWWYPELKKTLIPKFDTSDQDIRLAISLFFIMIVVMLKLKLEVALGAFIAGVAISAFFHHEKALEEKMSSFGFGFLVPLFFIHVGASFDIKALALDGIISGALLITFLMIFIRILSAVVLRHISGARNALLSALALSMPLTLLVAVATIGYETHLIDLLTYYQLILATLFEIIISMIAIKVLQRG
jgi:Kef-type K+ transport system membrane component KefB